MTRWKPDPTFYPFPRLAMQGALVQFGFALGDRSDDHWGADSGDVEGIRPRLQAPVSDAQRI